MMDTSYIEIPTWENNKWLITSFKTREDFKSFVLSIFKEPGKYGFDETSSQFNKQARIFNKDKLYCIAPSRTSDYKKYWDDQKNKCRKGVIYKSGNKIWYLTRDYYMWLNFLPIYDKEESLYGFAKVRDAQYHMALYELLAELHYKHVAVLKKRQIASSYFHSAKLINQIWFEEGVTLKMGANSKDQINEKGTWKFLNEYKNFLDQYTAWYRPMNPGKVLIWQQQIEVTVNNRKTTRGNKGTIQGLTFDKDATKGVGGPCKYFFYEEAGIAPTMNTTFEFVRPAMQSGMMTTGLFMAAGSVGDLDQCEPLKEMILYPNANDIYSVETNLIDDKGTIAMAGLFIPEQWSMPPYVDEFGNSLVEEAVKAIDDQRALWKKELSPEKYQLRISQHPKNIQEAFAYRKVSIFSQLQVQSQLRRIEEKTYAYEFLDIYRDDKGKVAVKETNKLPISDFPISPKLEDKQGVLVVWERPVKDPQFGFYYASIDPVSEGRTTTSESLCSIIVYKNAVEVSREDKSGKIQTFIERDGIVATWCGRFDDISKTHERLELIIEWYNSWTIIENNVSLFIQYMISQRKQRYLVPKDQILFLKDLGANQNVYQEYGWKNIGILFKTNLLSYAIEYLTESLDTETKPDGTIVKTTYGVERIPDPMILKEMEAYQPGLNVDRLVAFSALVAFVAIQKANRGIRRRIEEDPTKNLQKSKDLFKLSKSAFNHIGMNNRGKSEPRPPKNAFKNLH